MTIEERLETCERDIEKLADQISDIEESIDVKEERNFLKKLKEFCLKGRGQDKVSRDDLLFLIGGD